jgi:hypothetical protein
VIGGLVGLVFKFVGSLSDSLFADGGTLTVSPAAKTAINVAEVGWMSTSIAAGYFTTPGAVAAGIKSIGNQTWMRPRPPSPWSPKFPSNPDDFLPGIHREPTPNGFKMDVNPTTRVRYESHALNSGDTFVPRHHGQHYHVETRPHSGIGWNNNSSVTHVHPPGYVHGSGTGFLPGEAFPWELITNL